jgi:hypothetical protein
MANLTITIDKETLKQARIKALQQGTSVNAILKDYLESYAGSKSKKNDSISNLLKLSRIAKSRSKGKKWTRDELHER